MPYKDNTKERAAKRSYYYRNKEKVQAINRRTRERREQLIREAKDRPCADCGQSYPYYVMQFDHRDPSSKSFTISQQKQRPLSDLLAEIEKCDVVCANCHAIRTYTKSLRS